MAQANPWLAVSADDQSGGSKSSPWMKKSTPVPERQSGSYSERPERVDRVSVPDLTPSRPARAKRTVADVGAGAARAPSSPGVPVANVAPPADANPSASARKEFPRPRDEDVETASRRPERTVPQSGVVKRRSSTLRGFEAPKYKD